jgi:hypothetical protein
VAVHSTANLLHVCHRCHAWVESYRELAYAGGWLIPSHGLDPAEVPVWLDGPYGVGWWLLDADGCLAWAHPEDFPPLIRAVLSSRPVLPPWHPRLVRRRNPLIGDRRA